MIDLIEYITQYIESECLDCIYSYREQSCENFCNCKVKYYKELRKELENHMKIRKYDKIVHLVSNTLFHYERILSNKEIKETIKKYNFFDGFYEMLKIIEGVDE